MIKSIINLSAMPLVGLAMVVVFAAMAHGQNSGDAKSPFVGAWEVESTWEKGGSWGNQIVVVNDDLTGTLIDVKGGWETELRDVESNGDALSFSFYYENNKEYVTEFKGTVVGKELTGEFTILGATAKVEGDPISMEEAKQVQSRPSIVDFYEARSFVSSNNSTVNYRLFVPENYDPKKKYPIVLFHHGGGETGEDNRAQLESACIEEWILPEVQKNNPCFIVAPQFPGKGSKSVEDGTFSMTGYIQAIHEVLDSLEKEFSIDTNREYVTGLSFGGGCTWMALVERPDRFAAGVPICSYLIDFPVEEHSEKLATLPLWIFHGDADRVVPVDVSRNIVTALTEAGGNPKYTEYPGVGHYSWDLAFRDPELVAWLFSQERSAN